MMHLQLRNVDISNIILMSNSKFNIHKVHQHPSYNDRHKFDVAIIELEDEVTFSRGIFPICLPERSTPTNDREGSLVSFAGFGVTKYVNIVCNVS